MKKNSKNLDFSLETTRTATLNGEVVEILDFTEKDRFQGVMVKPHHYFGSKDFGNTWSPMTGVTTILSVIAKPALISWASNENTAYIKANSSPARNEEGGVEEGLLLVPESVLEEARLAHTRKKEDAGVHGTDLHALVEEYVKDCIKNHGGFPALFPSEEDATKYAKISPFVEWAMENKVVFLESEKKVYNPEHWYAGTLDLIIDRGTKKYICDVKTSSGIYGREFFAQMAGYEMCLNDKEDFDGRIVIRLGKDGSFEVKESVDFDTDSEMFLSALRIYRAQETYKLKK